MTKALVTIMYASLVSRGTVRLDLMIATLNHLEEKSGNILNAYVGTSHKIVWITLGPELGRDAGRTAVIVRALYGIK